MRKWPKKALWAGALALIVAVAGVVAARHIEGARAEQAHFERGETEVVATDLAGSRQLRVYMAGVALGAETDVADASTGPVWLAKGDYFLRADTAGETLFFPVTLTHFRCGPDEDGRFLLTVRSAPREAPPSGSYAYIPSGHFLIGERTNPREPHYVWLSGYFVGRFEVTNAEFQEFLRDPGGYNSPENWTEEGLRWKASNTSQASAILAPDHAEHRRFGQPDQPVTGVSWFEAHAFCQWMTAMNRGRHWRFRLPTDAQWEKAARGQDGFDYGLSRRISDEEAKLYNWKKNPIAEETVIGVEETRRRFKPNRYGIYHMSGNIAEWTQSAFRPFSRTAPYTEEDARNRDSLPDQRTARGGSWYSASIALLSASYRDAFLPEHRNNDLGFRVAVQVEP